jgi:Molybdopterin-binding domain of aldehyde dehydrogenase
VGQDVDRGDVTAALASAEVAYDEVFTTAAVTNNPMGLFATVDLREGNRLTVHDVSQWPTMARKTLGRCSIYLRLTSGFLFRTWEAGSGPDSAPGRT